MKGATGIKRIASIFALTLLAVAGFFIVSEKAAYAAADAYPDQANKYISVSNQGNGINLTAPESSIKMKFSGSADYFRIEIYDGRFQPGIDGGYNTSASTTFQVCASDSSGEKSLTNCTAQFNANTFSQTQPIPIQRAGAPASFAHSLNIPTVGGYKFLYLVARHSGPGLNGFRVSYANGFTNPAMTTQAPYTRIGFAGTQTSGGDYPMSLVHLPLRSTTRSNYSLTFRLPCNLSNERFRLAWYDADRPPNGIPYDTQIDWNIRNDSGQTLNASFFAFVQSMSLNTYLRGNQQGRSQLVADDPARFVVERGDLITWRWTNVLDNNGIQFSLPYSEADVDVTCPPLVNNSQCRPFTGGFGLPNAAPGENIALADISGNIITNKLVTPGQQVLLGVRFRNTGSSTWIGGFGVHALANNGSNSISVASAPAPYNTWSVSDTSNPKLVFYNNGSGETTPGQEVAFWFRVTLPTTFSGGQHTLSWRMRQTVAYEGRPVATFGGACSITVRERTNQPYLRVGGNDVLSGVSFDNTGETPSPDPDADELELLYDRCRAYQDANQDAIRDAGIQTNGYWSEEADASVRNLGSSGSQYAVFATGLVHNNPADTTSFPGNNGTARTARSGDDANEVFKDLVFANRDVSNYGHFEGQHTPGDTTDTRMLYCVDFMRDIMSGRVPLTPVATISEAFNSPQAAVQIEGDVTIGPSSLSTATGGRIAGPRGIVVNGTVTINTNIRYVDTYSINADGTPVIPSFWIIAKNGILIDGSVTQLDGNYVSLPTNDPNPNSGLVDTCHNVAGWPTGGGGGALTTGTCNNRLVINGTLSAKRIYWKRTYGTIGASDSAISGSCVYSPASRTNCAAEFINFLPEGDFGQWISGSSEGIPIDTVELPPIL